MADAGQIEQILMNLAVNARDAMPQGGRLSIETATVVLDDLYATQHVAVRPGPYVMLAVTDSGIGMERRDTNSGSSSRSSRPRSAAAAPVSAWRPCTASSKQSGGYVWVYSEAGHGSTFKVYLPRVDEERCSSRPVSDAASASPTGTETVLVVEDEQAVRLLSRTLLEQAGYHVFDAADPRQAEELFRQHADRIDLARHRRDHAGIERTVAVRAALRRTAGLRVLYMSGYTDNAIVQHAGLSPDIVFLQKPFTADGCCARCGRPSTSDPAHPCAWLPQPQTQVPWHTRERIGTAVTAVHKGIAI